MKMYAAEGCPVSAVRDKARSRSMNRTDWYVDSQIGPVDFIVQETGLKALVGRLAKPVKKINVNRSTADPVPVVSLCNLRRRK
ncbi:hypothetical protein Dda_6757 [Drechslerella dactyloides]|uniref:Uncharacterized protein n=1 Tax=Drechslerella dactyloides TaxID=74499 RepID=A0AAD6IUQ5_DREDA|nr:hypothetical protein Dda_6757 [Drechslerella dactyloides]